MFALRPSLTQRSKNTRHTNVHNPDIRQLDQSDAPNVFLRESQSMGFDCCGNGLIGKARPRMSHQAKIWTRVNRPQGRLSKKHVTISVKSLIYATGMAFGRSDRSEASSAALCERVALESYCPASSSAASSFGGTKPCSLLTTFAESG